MNGPITHPEQATPERLTGLLRRSGCLPRGKVIDVQAAVTSSFTSTIARLTLTFSDDALPKAPSHLFLKTANPDSEQRVVGREQWAREVHFHTQVAINMDDPPLVPCVDAAYDEESGHAHLLFHDASETHFQTVQPLPPPRLQCERTVDAFADFHAFWWDHTALGTLDELPTAQSVADYVTSVRACFPRFADFLGDRLSPARRQLYDWVLASLPGLFERVTRGTGLTLIHGDANFWNVMLPRDPHESRALIIDWQLWGISFAAEDLANLIALHWYRDRREALEPDLLRRYHEGLLRHGVRGYTWDDCWRDYRLAVVTRVLFMPMWQWSAGQSPAAWWPHLERAMQAFHDLECLLTVRES